MQRNDVRGSAALFPFVPDRRVMYKTPRSPCIGRLAVGIPALIHGIDFAPTFDAVLGDPVLIF